MNNLQVELGIAKRRVVKLKGYRKQKPNNDMVYQSYSNAMDKVKYLEWLAQEAEVEVLDGRPE